MILLPNIPHIPLLSTVCDGVGYFLLPLSAAVLWMIYEKRRTRMFILTALLILTVLFMCGAECCCLRRQYPWDHLTEHAMKGALVPLICLLGYPAYWAFCACLPEPELLLKNLGLSSLCAIGLAAGYVYLAFPLSLLGFYMARPLVREKFPSQYEVFKRRSARYVTGMTVTLSVLALMWSVYTPPLRCAVCAEVEREMLYDMAQWCRFREVSMHTRRFLGMWPEGDGYVVKYYCETDQGPMIYKAFCNAYGGYQMAECAMLEL